MSNGIFKFVQINMKYLLYMAPGASLRANIMCLSLYGVCYQKVNEILIIEVKLELNIMLGTALDISSKMK